MALNTHIDSAQSRIDEETGLRTVSFVVQGIPDWPTALNANYTLLSSPIDAFRGGAAAIKLPPKYDYALTRNVALYTCESIVAADGSAIALVDGKKLLRQYYKLIEFPFPGRVDMTLDKGPVMYPPTTLSVPAKVSVYLLDENAAKAVPQLPYQVKEWISYGANYVPVETLVPTSEGGAARGYLVGNVWAGTHTQYKGADVETVVAWGQSTPSYAQFVADIAAGKVVERAVAPAFSDAYGKPFYVMREVFVQYSK